MKNLSIYQVAIAFLFFASLMVSSALAQCNGSHAKASNKQSNWNASYGSEHRSDIVDLAAGTDALSSLVAAVKAAGLVETLKSDGPFTVFAPSNEAFKALPAGTIENLLKPENRAQLVKILTYHVIPGKISSHDLQDGMRAATVQGKEVLVRVGKAGVSVDNAKVIQADVNASNGVVHVIDRVIMP